VRPWRLDQLRIGNVLRKCERIAGRNHDVPISVPDQRRLLMVFTSANRSPRTCRHSVNAACWAFIVYGELGVSTSFLRR